MCIASEQSAPIAGAVFRIDGKNLFEVALYAENGNVPGEIPLTQRFKLRFGTDKVHLRKDGPAATVIQITCEPVANIRGLEFIGDLIAAATSQHYGHQIEVDIKISERPMCQPYRRTRTTRVRA